MAAANTPISSPTCLEEDFLKTSPCDPYFLPKVTYLRCPQAMRSSPLKDEKKFLRADKLLEEKGTIALRLSGLIGFNTNVFVPRAFPLTHCTVYSEILNSQLLSSLKP